MKNISDKNCRETQNTHFLFNFFFENRALYEIMWKNIVERGRPHIIQYGACALHAGQLKATNTHNGCVTLIAFSMLQLLQERASVLPSTYIACLVSSH